MDLSVVIPVYNEEECIRLLYASVKEVCGRLDLHYEIVFIDDGSTDATYDLLSELHHGNPKVKIIKFRKNYGQTAAMAAGFAYAQGAIIVSLDGDLQNDPAEIPRLLAKLEEGYDVVCGWRKNRRDRFWTRRVPSVVANWLIGRVTGVRVHDNGCSLKAYRASVIKSVVLYGEMHRFIPAMARLTGARIAEIGVNHHPRSFGRSKYGIGRTWRVVLDIITIKMITSFASRPAHWFGFLSFPCMASGLSALFVASGVYLGRLIEEWMVMSTVALLFLILGIHLLAMGIIAELAMKTGDYRPKKTLHSSVTVL
jgi:glycosyltransferase involved in cell wall biosynthesis